MFAYELCYAMLIRVYTFIYIYMHISFALQHCNTSIHATTRTTLPYSIDIYVCIQLLRWCVFSVHFKVNSVRDDFKRSFLFVCLFFLLVELFLALFRLLFFSSNWKRLWNLALNHSYYVLWQRSSIGFRRRKQKTKNSFWIQRSLLLSFPLSLFDVSTNLQNKAQKYLEKRKKRGHILAWLSVN